MMPRYQINLYIETDDDEDTLVDAVEAALTQAGIDVDELCVVD